MNANEVELNLLASEVLAPGLLDGTTGIQAMLKHEVCLPASSARPFTYLHQELKLKLKLNVFLDLSSPITHSND